MPESHEWPVAGTGCLSIAPQAVQVRCDTQSEVQVAEVTVDQDDHECAMAGTGCVSVAPQTVQVRCDTPSEVQVAGVIVVHEDHEWKPDAEINDFYSDSNADDPLAAITKRAFMVKGDKLIEWNSYKPSGFGKFKKMFFNFG